MLKIIVFILCALPSSFSSTFTTPKRCIINKFGLDQCASDVCFSHFHTVSEGNVERFDCSEGATNLSKDTCVRLLNSTKQSSICFGNSTDTHCCCLSTLPAEICAPDRRKLTAMFALWTTKQALFLLFGHLSLLFIILVIAFFYKKAVEMWPADNLPIPENSILYKVLMAKPVFLLISFLFLYFPFLKDCMNHPNGVFVVSRQFLYEIFDAGMIPSLFFSFPLVFSIADGAFFLYIKRKKSINQSGGVALSIFILITMTLFVYDSFFSSFQKWRPSPGYCRLIAAMWQFIIAQTFIILYHVSILFQTIVLSRMSANRGGDGTEATPPDDAELSSHVATLLSTQTVETRIESDSSEMVYIWPRPFSVPRMGMNVLNVKSNRTDKWIALRALLSTTGFYKVYPTKFFIPPGKEISMEVECVTRADCPDVNHNLLLEWFYLPNDHLTVDTDVVWRKPYPVPQEKWQYFVLPVYLDDSNYGSDSKSSQ